MFAEDQRVSLDADAFRAHDLIGQGVVQHAVLMDAGLVGESVVADDRFVGRRRESGQVLHDAGGPVNLAGVQADLHAEVLAAGGQRHGDFLQCGVAGAFAETVDRAFHLVGAGHDGGDGIGGGHAEVVVAVDADDRFFDIGRMFADIADQAGEFIRHGIADGIGNIDDCRSLPDGHAEDLRQKGPVAAGSVFRRKFHVGRQGAGVADRRRRGLQHFGAGHLELVLQMDVAAGDERVDSRAFRLADAFPGAVDILFVGPGQSGDRRSFYPGGDSLYGREVARRSGGESGFDDVDFQSGQGQSDLNLLFDSQTNSGTLFSIAQGGVKKLDAPVSHAVFLLLSLISWLACFRALPDKENRPCRTFLSGRGGLIRGTTLHSTLPVNAR